MILSHPGGISFTTCWSAWRRRRWANQHWAWRSGRSTRPARPPRPAAGKVDLIERDSVDDSPSLMTHHCRRRRRTLTVGGSCRCRQCPAQWLSGCERRLCRSARVHRRIRWQRNRLIWKICGNYLVLGLTSCKSLQKLPAVAVKVERRVEEQFPAPGRCSAGSRLGSVIALLRGWGGLFSRWQSGCSCLRWRLRGQWSGGCIRFGPRNCSSRRWGTRAWEAARFLALGSRALLGRLLDRDGDLALEEQRCPVGVFVDVGFSTCINIFYQENSESIQI